jgi:hypothetical protein
MLHFVAENHTPETLDFKKKKVISHECTASCQMSAEQFVLVRHRYQYIIFTSLYAFPHDNSSIQFLRMHVV